MTPLVVLAVLVALAGVYAFGEWVGTERERARQVRRLAQRWERERSYRG